MSRGLGDVYKRQCYEKVGFKERTLTENAFSFKDESWGRCNMITTR